MLNKKKFCLFLCLKVYSAFASDFEKEEKNFLPYTSSSQVCVHVIPDELMLKILSALELPDLDAVRKVNKDFFRLTRDKSIVDSIFTDRLGKLINLVDKLPPYVKVRSRVGQWQYVQDYWEKLYCLSSFDYAMKSVKSEKQGAIWSFLLALTKLSQSSLSLITDLIEIPINTVTELKKVFMIGAYEQTLFLQSMKPSECSSVIRSCLRLTPGQLDTVAIHAKESFTEDMDRNQCSKIIKVCQELTPRDIELRSKTLQMHASSLFNETMNGDDIYCP